MTAIPFYKPCRVKFSEPMVLPVFPGHRVGRMEAVLVFSRTKNGEIYYRWAEGKRKYNASAILPKIASLELEK